MLAAHAAMAVHKHDPDMSDESDFDFDEEYFERSYRPLSNLPTPPPSSRNSSASHSPQPSIDDGETLDPTFLGEPSKEVMIGQSDIQLICCAC